MSVSAPRQEHHVTSFQTRAINGQTSNCYNALVVRKCDVVSSVKIKCTAGLKTVMTNCSTYGCKHVFKPFNVLYGTKAFSRCPLCKAFVELKLETDTQ